MEHQDHKQEIELNTLNEIFKTPEKNAFISAYIAHRCSVPEDLLPSLVDEVIDEFISDGVRHFFFIDPINPFEKSNSITFYQPCYSYLLDLKKDIDIGIYAIIHYPSYKPILPALDHFWNIPPYHYFEKIAPGANYILCSHSFSQHNTSALLKYAKSNDRAIVRDVNYEYLTKYRENSLQKLFKTAPRLEGLYYSLKLSIDPQKQSILDKIMLELSNKNK